MDSYDFVVTGTPVSAQANDRAARRRWMNHVRDVAIRNAPVLPPFWEPGVRLSIVHLFVNAAIDVDNIVKPIQDGLEMAFYPDDAVVTDLDAHRRFIGEEYDAAAIPELLHGAWSAGEECVYVRVQRGGQLEECL